MLGGQFQILPCIPGDVNLVSFSFSDYIVVTSSESRDRSRSVLASADATFTLSGVASVHHGPAGILGFFSGKQKSSIFDPANARANPPCINLLSILLNPSALLVRSIHLLPWTEIEGSLTTPQGSPVQFRSTREQHVCML